MIVEGAGAGEVRSTLGAYKQARRAGELVPTIGVEPVMHEVSEASLEEDKLKDNMKKLAENFAYELEELTSKFREDRSTLQMQIALKEEELGRHWEWN